MKNPEMLKFAPDHLKTTKMCKHAVKKLHYLLRCVPDKYKTQKMCDKAILENGGTLKSVPDCNKNQEMCNKTVDNYSPALEFVPERYEAQKICDKAVDTYPSTTIFVAKCFMTQEMCDKAVNRYYFVSDSIPDRCKTQMCDEAVNDSIAALKVISDWFVTCQMIKKLSTALYADENILYFNGDSGNAVFNCNETGILNIHRNNINLYNNFDEDDPDTIILIRLLDWPTKIEKWKAVKKELNEELMPVAWHPNRWQDWCVSEDEKKL